MKYAHLHSTPEAQYILIGPIIVALAVGAYKSFYIASEISTAWTSTVLQLYGADLTTAGWIALLCIGAAVVQRTFIKSLFICTAVLLNLVHIVDCAVTVAIDQRLAYDQFVQFLPEWQAALQFLEPRHIVYLCLISGFFLLKLQASRAKIVVTFVTASCMIVTGSLTTLPTPLKKYSRSLISILSTELKVQRGEHLYSEEEIGFHAPHSSSAQVQLLDETGHIVLIIVESLSAVDSFKTSGLNNRLPRLDTLSNDGTLFTNFIANHWTSEGGLISLLGGIPPLPFPTSSQNLFASFSGFPTIVSALGDKGYHTTFLTTASMNFLDMAPYMKQVGFDEVLTGSTVKSFRGLPRTAYHSPADEYLYQEALARIKVLLNKHKPFFMTLETVSSHRPYMNRAGEYDTEDNVWAYIDSQIELFYVALRQMGYFDRGTLIITSDHRKMQPISDLETKRYGESAGARIPLIVIGNKTPQNVVDHRPYQQSDLFRQLGNVPNPNIALSPFTIAVPARPRRVAAETNPVDATIFEYSGESYRAHPVAVFGNEIRWLRSRPETVRLVEAQIHAQRSIFQKLNERTSGSCALEYEIDPSGTLKPGGLWATVYRGQEINGQFSLDSNRFDSRRVVDKIEFDAPSQLNTMLENNFAVVYRGFLEVQDPGLYLFRATSDDGVCLAINQSIVIDENRPKAFLPVVGQVRLNKGLHSFELRYFQARGAAKMQLHWLPPSKQYWSWEPINSKFLRFSETHGMVNTKR